MEKFVEYKKLIRNILQNSPGTIALTVDLWTSTANDSYFEITAHFVDKDWKLRFLVLDFCLMPQPHTGEALKDTILTILTDLGIEHKFLALQWTMHPV